VISIKENIFLTPLNSNYINYPSMKGALYLRGVGYASIKMSTFTENDAGPIFDKHQKNGVTNIDHIIE